MLFCARALAGDGLLWFDGDRPGAQAHQAVALLGEAASHGLEPQDYGADALRQAVAQAMQAAQPDPESTARVERALTTAMQRYLADLHFGRIDPRLLHHDFDAPRRGAFDPDAYLRAALAAQRLPEAARESAPSVPMYEHLRKALADYRELADHPAWRQPLSPLPRPRSGSDAKLEPGQAYAGLPLLAQRLVALGDLAPQAATPPHYDAPMVRAIESFQQRHGLAADGVVGKATLAQLEVSPAARVRQIELMLERLRWTPLMRGSRMIVVNIPEFMLRAYEVRDGRISVLLEMKVIVGKALDLRTPVFDEDMRYIEFSPFWNVPPSIARAEILPHLRRDPRRFEREGFEFVAPDGSVIASFSSAALDDMAAGKLRIRQRPGPHNPLGDIKFVLPNREHIYLHDTPSARLFARYRRDLSHGCIRVEQPVALAKFVLEDMPQWTEERIRDAMREGQSATLRLAQPVPVLIAYGTTLILGGRVHFFPDLYGHDQSLDAALRRHAPNRQTINP